MEYDFRLKRSKIEVYCNKRNPLSILTHFSTIGQGRRSMQVGKKKMIFAQGDATDAVFYIQKGKVKLTVVSSGGKEATIGILGHGDFFGEGCLAGQTLCIGSAGAMTNCEILRINKQAMMLALHREHKLSDLFVAYLLTRNIRYQEDLVDQLFNSRKTISENSSSAGPLRHGGSSTDSGPRNQSNHSGGDGGN
jgi:CRP-like cAMP-binding protein